MFGMALVDQEVAQCSQQQSPEPAALRIGVAIPATFDEAQEEGLGEVLGIGGAVTAVAHEREYGWTVGATELLERVAGLRGVIARRVDQAPACGLEAAHWGIRSSTQRDGWPRPVHGHAGTSKNGGRIWQRPCMDPAFASRGQQSMMAIPGLAAPSACAPHAGRCSQAMPRAARERPWPRDATRPILQ